MTLGTRVGFYSRAKLYIMTGHMKRIKFAFTVIACLLTACAPVATNSNPQRKLDSEITRLDSIAIILAEIRALDQGIRDNSTLFLANSRAFNLHTDSLCFSKAIWVIEHYGYIKNLGKYNDSFGYLSEALPAVLLHNPQRLIEPHTYDLLKREVETGGENGSASRVALEFLTYETRVSSL